MSAISWMGDVETNSNYKTYVCGKNGQNQFKLSVEELQYIYLVEEICRWNLLD